MNNKIMLDFSKTVNFSELKNGTEYWMLDISEPGWLGYSSAVSMWKSLAIVPKKIQVIQSSEKSGELLYTSGSTTYQRRALSNRILSKDSEPQVFLESNIFLYRVIIIFSNEEDGVEFGNSYLHELWKNSDSKIFSYVKEVEDTMATILNNRRLAAEDISLLEEVTNKLNLSSSKNFLRNSIRKIEASISSSTILKNSSEIIRLIKGECPN